MKKSLIFKTLIKIILIVMSFTLNSKINALTRKEFENAFKETANAYYMRGKNIQYNSSKADTSGVFSPEEATSQNINYLVCSQFVYNTYYNLLEEYIPKDTSKLMGYAKKNFGKPEVIGYGFKNNNDLEMYFYTGNNNEECKYNGNKIKGCQIKINPTLDDIISYLKVGDILTYSGHTGVVYDLIKDENDVYFIESAHGKRKNYYVNSKIDVNLNHYLYYNDGSIKLSNLKSANYWSDLVSEGGKSYIVSKDEYSILRFVSDDTENVKLQYQDSEKNGNGIVLSSTAQNRNKFSKLYIEKTVNKHNDDVVNTGDILTYTITVKNNSDINYPKDIDINVVENISQYVELIGNYDVSKSYTLSKPSSNQIQFNIGQLQSSEEVTIKYSVKVKEGYVGKKIESTGNVAGIASSTIKNTIGNSFNESQKLSIIKSYNNLKSKYSDKTLINKIYEDALDVDLKFNNFSIDDLVQNNDMYSSSVKTITLNTNSSFYKMILNKYYNTLYKVDDKYDIKLWNSYSDLSRRADTIYGENFQTGDILIYKNSDDSSTYENGEYYFIYIDGKGFVGVNNGNDGISGNEDDRNEFNANYYSDKGLKLYTNSSQTDSEFLSFANYQTLFGKDSYVILRPSIMLAAEPDIIFKNIGYDYIDDKHIMQINEVNVNQNKYNEKVVLKSGYTMQVELNDNGKVYTGSKTKIYSDSQLLLIIVNSLKGDVSGDGDLSSMDYIKIRNHIMKVENKMISGDEYLDAADYNNDNKISSLDYVKIRNYIMSNN